MKPRPAASPSSGAESPLLLLLPWLALLWLGLYWTFFFSSHLPNAGGGIARLDVIALLPQIYQQLITPDGADQLTSGWRYFPQRLDLLLVAGCIGCVCLCTGRLILRGLGIFSATDRPTACALAGSVGFSAVSLLTLMLGLAGLLHPLLFIVTGGLLVGAEGWLTVRKRKQQKTASAPKQGQPKRRSQRAMWICLGISAPFVLCMLLGSMLPTPDFDCREYHLQGPKEYFEAGRVQLLPHNVYTSFPFLTEMLTLAGMVVRGDWFRGALIGQVVLMLFAPLTALGVWCVARRLAGELAAWAATVIFLSTPWVYRISIIPYTEGALCCFVVMTLLAFCVWREQQALANPLAVRWVFVTGLLAGSAVATKYPGMVLVAIPFACAVGAAQWKSSGLSLRPLLQVLLYYGAGVLVTFGPWMAKNLVETGNPVYPLLYSVFGGFDWNPEINEKWRAAHSTPATAFWNVRAAMQDVAINNDWQSPLLFGLAPLAFLRRRSRLHLAILLDVFVILAAWFLLTHRIDRFWVPVIPLLAALAGCGLANLLSQSPRDEITPADRLLRGVALLLVAGTLIYNLGYITTALAGNNMYLQDEAVVREKIKKPSIALLEDLPLPEGAKVLFVGEAEVFDTTFPHRYNTVFDDSLLEQWTSTRTGPGEWQLLPVDEIRRNLQAEGIAYVFVNWSEILRYRATYRYTDFVSPRRMQELVDAGVLAPVPIADPRVHRLEETVQGGEKLELDRWGPELKRRVNGLDAIEQFQLYRVVDAPQRAKSET
ncbi:ArnT family glycosyltransferase [Planctomicrobium sp. SH664]|uniref:ArnT family glycosyltransferase n=1 Tax=Planctomicrobium sp. SH664 TaxID=3448125 RepID=UPI003F5C9342